MPFTDAARIRAQTAQPAGLMLWRALQPLRGLVRFMAVGAHPEAMRHIKTTRQHCEERQQTHALHRLDRTAAQLARVLFLACGARLTARLGVDHAEPGQTVPATLALIARDPAWHLPQGWHSTNHSITLPDDAAPFNPYPMTRHANAPQGPVAALVTMTYEGITASLRVPPEQQLLVLPKHRASVDPAAIFVNKAAPKPIALNLTQGANLRAPKGWAPIQTAVRMTLTPIAPEKGLFILPITVGDQPAQSVVHSNHPHIGPLMSLAPATLRLRVADVALAPARIAYIGGGIDRVDHWLRAMGADVTTLPHTAPTASTLQGYDSLVIGIFALRFRPALGVLMPAIRDWVLQGGTLLTLYHRPWDNWDAAHTAPARLEIGEPSLRYRVTDETAIVTHLAPDHPLLRTPNTITPDDWAGWVKERGHYFAKSWDAAYKPVVQMADPDEAPHDGALLSGQFGAGQHHQCALILHFQMEALVPEAFRLMANMIAPKGGPH